MNAVAYIEYVPKGIFADDVQTKTVQNRRSAPRVRAPFFLDLAAKATKQRGDTHKNYPWTVADRGTAAEFIPWLLCDDSTHCNIHSSPHCLYVGTD